MREVLPTPAPWGSLKSVDPPPLLDRGPAPDTLLKQFVEPAVDLEDLPTLPPLCPGPPSQGGGALIRNSLGADRSQPAISEKKAAG